MADIVLLFILKGRDCMSKVLIEVLVIILIAGSYLILYSTVRVSAIADQRIAEIRSRETFDKEKQLKTNQSKLIKGNAADIWRDVVCNRSFVPVVSRGAQVRA